MSSTGGTVIFDKTDEWESRQDASKQPPTAQTPAKSMAGKYDGRGKYKRTAMHKRAIADSAPKPRWLKNLSVNDSIETLDKLDAIAGASEIYKRALERNMLALCWQIREGVKDRLIGKPFVAENPNAKPQPNNILNDNRLQIAIQQLVPAKQARKSKKTQVIQAVSEAKQLTTSEPAEQVYVDGTSQVIDSTEDASK